MALLPVLGAVDVATIESQIAMWQRTLDGVKQTAIIAMQAGNQSMLDQARAGMLYIEQQLAALYEQLPSGVPSSTMLALSAFSDQAISAARSIGAQVSSDLETANDTLKSTLKAAGVTVSIVPIVLLGALVILGVMAAKGNLGVKAHVPVPI